MDFADYLEMLLDARERVAFERAKTPPSERECEWADYELINCRKLINEHIDGRIQLLAGVAVREYGE